MKGKMLKQTLIVTHDKARFLELAEELASYACEITWADTGKSALDAVAGSPDLIVIDEIVDGRPGLELAKKIIQVNALVNLVVVSPLSPEDFHEAAEGLGILAQVPPAPGISDAGRLLDALNALS